jgi:hypothetical protein
MSTSDHEINRGVRGVLSRHWVDLSSTSFASRKGIVRLMGELRRIGPESSASLESTNIVAIDAELRRIRGVQRVHLELANWRKDEDGEWVAVERPVDVDPAQGQPPGP